jgi:hypothetical protein
MLIFREPLTALNQAEKVNILNIQIAAVRVFTPTNNIGNIVSTRILPCPCL